MKLYTRFKEVVDALRAESKLTKAWFTSFNLSPYFVESYILPPLVGDPPCPVKSMGFEALYQKILQSDIDVRFFYDHRAIELSESKRTVVHFCPVDPRALEVRYSIPFGRGVFHPKVIFFQNENGKSWLFASSANLTVSGWSRNREAVLDREVRSPQNRRRVIEFFNAIAGEEIIEESSFPSKSGRDKWEFVHSLDVHAFLDRLLEDQPRSLYIWSPYFSNNLCKLLENRIRPKMSVEPEIGIVPDIENERIRVAENQRQPLLSLPFVRFFCDEPKTGGMDSTQMNHAKVWLTESHLAVGSWNLTESALNISSDAGACNVEAGIITTMDTNTYEELQPSKPLDLKKIDFMAEEELDRDRRFLMDSLPFQIQVYRDWSHDLYEISLDGDAHGSVYTIRLPGVDENHKLAFTKTNQRVSMVRIQRALKEHIYTVFQRHGGVDEERYRGMIIDLETGNRPVWRYSSFNELLYAWAQAPESVDSVTKNADSYELVYIDSIDHHFNDDETSDTPVQPSIDITFSYFTMFCAFENIRERLRSDKMDSAEKLKIMLKTQPGSLFEISDKVQKLISDPRVSGVYKWFVQEEINSLLRIAISKLEQMGDDSLSDAIDKKLVRAIEDRSLFDRFADRDKKWIQYLKKVSRYGSVR